MRRGSGRGLIRSTEEGRRGRRPRSWPEYWDYADIHYYAASRAVSSENGIRRLSRFPISRRVTNFDRSGPSSSLPVIGRLHRENAGTPMAGQHSTANDIIIFFLARCLLQLDFPRLLPWARPDYRRNGPAWLSYVMGSAVQADSFAAHPLRSMHLDILDCLVL